MAVLLPLVLLSAVTTVLATPAGPALATGTAPSPKHPLVIPNGGQPFGTANHAGYLPGSAGVTPTGAFTYRLPLAVPEGRNGMAPQLALTYASGSADGPFGLGWSLSGMTSAITRCGRSPDTDGTRSGVHYDRDDLFCLDRQKLVGLGAAEPGASGEYGDHLTVYHTEADSFAQIVSLNNEGSTATRDTGPDRFEVRGKDGRIRVYEARTAPRRQESVSLTEPRSELVPDGECVEYFDWLQGQWVEECETKYYRAPVLAPRTEDLPAPRVVWLLASERDRSDNEIRYEYDWVGGAMANEYRLTHIRYTYGPGRPAARSVDFEYETRPDPSFSYVAGVRFQQTQRVTAISMSAPNPGATEVVRRYTLSYLPTGTDPGQHRRSLLSQVQECGPMGGCLMAKQLIWGPAAVPQFTSTAIAPLDVDTMAPTGMGPKVHVQDLDGDGSDDIVFSRGGYGTGEYARLGQRNAAGAVAPLAQYHQLSGHGAWPLSGSGGVDLPYSRPMDIDGNGSTEFVVRTGPPGHDQVLRWDAAAAQFVSAGPPMPIDTAWDDFGDVNGDGLMDRVVGVPSIEVDDGGGQFANWNELRVAVQLNTGGGTFGQPVVSNVDAKCPRRLSDADGDGRADLLTEKPYWWLSTKLCGLGTIPYSLSWNWTQPLVDSVTFDDAGVATTHSGMGAPADGNTDPGFRVPFVNPQRAGNIQEHITSGSTAAHTHLNGLYGWRTVLGDFNGDGLRDTLLVPTIRGANGGWERPGAILWNTGTGQYWDYSTVDLAHDPLADLRVADINGDGRDDVVSFYNATLTVGAGADGEVDTIDDVVQFGAPAHDRIAVYLSKGNGQFTGSTMVTSAGFPQRNDPQVGRQFSQLGDFNGDGRPDIMRNDGTITVLTQAAAVPERITDVKDEGAGWPQHSVTYGTDWTDHPELMSTAPACAAPLQCLRRGMPVVRLLYSRENAYSVEDLGVHTFYDYFDPVAHLRQGFLGFGTVRAWTPERPVEVVSTYDLRTAEAGGRYYPYGSRPATVTTAVPILTPAVVAQQPTTVTTRVTRVENSSEFRPLNSDATFVIYPDRTTTSTWEQPAMLTWQNDLTGAAATVHVGGIPATTPTYPARRVEQDFQHDNFGNLEHSTSTTTGGSTEETTYGYDLSQPRREDWLISLRTTSEVTRSEADGDPAPVTRRTENGYDSLGRLDTVWLERYHPDPDVQQTTHYDLDPTGVVLTTTVSAPNRSDQVSHTGYTPVFPGQPDELIHPSQLWSEHNQLLDNGQYDDVHYRPSSWQAVHPAFGLTVATEDINGVDSATYHDDLGRPVMATATQQPTVLTSYQRYVNYQGDVAGLTVRTLTATGPPGSNLWHLGSATTDIAGHTRSTVTGGFDGTVITVDSGYDAFGRLTSTTRPYLYGAAPAGSTSHVQDSLDRPVTTTLPDQGVLSWTYVGLFVTNAFDVDNARTETTSDVDGRKVLSTRYHDIAPPGAPPELVPITDSYDYAPFDQVRRATDDAGNIVTTGYDVRGRATTVDDPDRGTVVTRYDGIGEVRSIEHSGSGNTTTFTVDDLGRVITRADGDGTATRSTTFRYDTASSGVGQLHYATSPDAIRTSYRYDDLGHRVGTDITDETTNTTYRTDTSYDLFSRVATLTYPELPGHWRFATTNGYNNEGYLATVSDATTTPAATLWRATARNADLALTGAALGQPLAGPAAITLAREHDGPTGHLTAMTATSAAGTTLQSLGYGYYPDGLVETRTQADSSAARNETYSYDDLHRLTGWELANGTAPTVTTGYAYDSLGNLTAITGGAPGQAETRGIGRPDGTLPHALTSRQNESYGYDRQGRMISTSRTEGHETTVTEQVSYNAHDLPKTITVPGAGTWSLRYDAFGSRVAKSGPDGSTFYVPGLFEHRVSPGGQHSYVHLVTGPDGPIGQYSTDGTAPGTVTYTLTDALGSTGTTTNQAGQPTGSFFYEPYGARVNADGTAAAPYTGAVHNGFTGHEHDDPLGKINMKGRIYSATAKAFLSPDPVTSNHPYMYVNGNPTNAIDPTGFDGFYTEGYVGFDSTVGVTFSYPTVNLDYLYNNSSTFYANFSMSSASWSDWDGYYARTAWYDQALDWYWGRIERVAYALGDKEPSFVPLSEQVRGKTFSPDEAALLLMSMADGMGNTTNAMTYWAETSAALQGMQPREAVLDGNGEGSGLGDGGLERFRIAAGPYRTWDHQFAYVDDLMTGTTRLFYESSGSNSGRPGTWFPSNGIDIGAEKVLKAGTYQQQLDYFIAKMEGNEVAMAELRALIREGGPELKPAFDWMNAEQRVLGDAIPLTPQELNTVGHGLQVPLGEPNPFFNNVPPPAGWGPNRFDFMKNYGK